LGDGGEHFNVEVFDRYVPEYVVNGSQMCYRWTATTTENESKLAWELVVMWN